MIISPLVQIFIVLLIFCGVYWLITLLPNPPVPPIAKNILLIILILLGILYLLSLLPASGIHFG